MNNFFLWVLRNAAEANVAVEDVKKYLGREKALLNGQLYIQFESKKANPKKTEGSLQLLLFVFSINGISYFRLRQ